MTTVKRQFEPAYKIDGCFIVSEGTIWGTDKTCGKALVSYLGMTMFRNIVGLHEVEATKQTLQTKGRLHLQQLCKSFSKLSMERIEETWMNVSETAAELQKRSYPNIGYKLFRNYSTQNLEWQSTRTNRLTPPTEHYGVPQSYLFWENPNYIAKEWNSPRREILTLYF